MAEVLSVGGRVPKDKEMAGDGKEEQSRQRNAGP